MTSLGWRSDLMIRRMMGSQVEDRHGVVVVHTPANPAFHWGNFLLLPQPPSEADVEPVLRAWRLEFPDAAHRAVGIDGADGRLGHPALAAALAAVPEISPVMTAGALDPVGPIRAPDQELTVRPLDPDDDADWRSLLELRRASDDQGAESLEYLMARGDEAREASARGYGAWWAVFVDGTPKAELGIFTDGSGIARYQQVGTHPDFRRRRFASALVTAAGRWALAELPKVRTLVIIADGEGPAAGIYRRLGFVDREWSSQLYRPPTSTGKDEGAQAGE